MPSAVLLLVAAYLLRSIPSAPIPLLAPMPEFAFNDSEANSFRSPDSFIGRTSLVNFFFTSCQGPCPALMKKMQSIEKKLRDLPQFQFVSITIDPERDDIEKLNAYAAARGIQIGPRWHFLRGDLSKTLQLSEETFRLGLDLPQKIHTTRVAVVDSKGNLRGVYSTETVEDIDKVVNILTNLANENR